MTGASNLTEHSVADAARTAGFAGLARYVERTGSTNADLLAEAERGAPSWSVLVAGHQHEGRGRLGRAWVAPPGTSLLVSVLLRPDLSPGEAPVLALAAAVAAVDALRDAAGLSAGCKWPNDVLVGGRKVAGILTEAKAAPARLEHVVVGMGMNVLQTASELPADAAATSVAIEAGTADPVALLVAFLRRLRTAVSLAARPGREELLGRYRAVCLTLGRGVRADLGGGATVLGRAVAVGRAGELVVRTEDAEVVLASGEVAHVR
jgi:BirA family biotin operon repressor/biotin-[acetyl-CoA-carboxylase] ligase